MANASHDVIESIKTLLDENYYVPLLRSEDPSCQPIIGEPFLATKAPVCLRVPIIKHNKTICIILGF
jgi:hypothetical protein